jgi:hypothetical protein
VVLVSGILWIVLNAAGLISFSPCPFHLITGWACPSCGTTRAIMALIHGNIAGSLLINPIAIVVCLLLLCFGLCWTWDLLTGRNTRVRIIERFGLLIQRRRVALPLVVLVLANWIWNISKGL